MKHTNQQFHNIKQFFIQMVPSRHKHFVLSFFAGIPSLFLNLLLASMFKGIYSAINAESIPLILHYIAFFILMTAGFFIYNNLFWNLYGKSLALITGDLRRITAYRFCSLHLGSVAKHHSGYFMTIFTSDLNNAGQLYTDLRQYIGTLTLGVVPSVIIFYTSIPLGFFILSCTLLQAIFQLFLLKPLHRLSLNLRKELQNANEALTDIIKNNEAIRLCVAEPFYLSQYQSINRRLYRAKIKLNLIGAASDTGNIFFGLLGYILTLSMGAWLVFAKKLTLPDLLYITQLRAAMIQGIITMSSYVVHIQPAMAGVENILGFMNQSIEKNSQLQV